MKRNALAFKFFLNFISISVIILFKHKCYGFFLHQNGKRYFAILKMENFKENLFCLEFSETDNQKLINNYKIIYNKLDNTTDFPDEFYLHFNNFENDFKLKFVKKRSNDHLASVFTTTNDGKIIEHEFKGENLVSLIFF